MHRFEIEKIWDFDKYGDRCALISDEEQSISYKTLKEASDLVADAIDERCLVFSLCNNEIGSIIGYVGFVNNGIVPALLSTHLDEDLLNSLFDIYAPSFIWLPDDQIEKYAQFSVVLRSYGYALMRTNYEKK